MNEDAFWRLDGCDSGDHDDWDDDDDDDDDEDEDEYENENEEDEEVMTGQLLANSPPTQLIQPARWAR